MNVLHREKIVLLGMMTKMPVAGVVWQTAHYLVGLERLGYEVYYVEAHARTPSMLMQREEDDGSALAAAFIEGVMRRFGLAGRWAYHALHDDGRCFGMSMGQLKQLYRSASLLINLHGGTMPLPEHYETRCSCKLSCTTTTRRRSRSSSLIARSSLSARTTGTRTAGCRCPTASTSSRRASR
jgi:hypothetical protein